MAMRDASSRRFPCGAEHNANSNEEHDGPQLRQKLAPSARKPSTILSAHPAKMM